MTTIDRAGWGRIVSAAALTFALIGGPKLASAQDLGVGERAAELTDRFSQRVAQALRLDEERARRLRETLQESRERRQELAVRRRALLTELSELAHRDRVDQDRVALLLDVLVGMQVREAEINVDEQRRLGEFMDPLERARLLWLRQRFLQQARQRRGLPQGDDLDPGNQIPGVRRPPPSAEQRTVPDRPSNRP